MSDNPLRLVFEVFTEIGIIEQLSRTLLEARLPNGLIAPHFAVLNHLTRLGDGRTPIEMARAFQTPKTSMTHTLKVLESRGLIDMRPNPEDGRSKCVWLTQTGRDVRENTINRLAQDFQGMVGQVGPEKFATLRPILQELRIFLDENRETTDAPDA